MPAQVIDVGDVISVQVWCSDSEQASVNTVYWKCNAITFGSDYTTQDAADLFDLGFSTFWKSFISNTATYRGVVCSLPLKLPLQLGRSATASSGVGTAGAIGMARQSAGLISWSTDRAGPGGRGRLFLPFPSTTDDAGLGVPTAGYLAKLDSFIAAFLAGTTLGTVGGPGPIFGAPVLLSQHSKVTPGTFTYPLTGGTSRPAWATQKKRGSYGRANASPI